MGVKTGIEWTDATWNPIRGCSRVSEGCRNCYAERDAYRFSRAGQPYEGLAVLKNGHASWTGKIQFVRKHLLDPLKWREVVEHVDDCSGVRSRGRRTCECLSRPRRIFVNSMSDLFHEGVTDEMRDEIFDVMQEGTKHAYQILTKRPQEMKRYCEYRQALGEQLRDSAAPEDSEFAAGFVWPLPNVWLGVSVENQAAADERIPLLLETPAAVRFISAEPLLGPVSLEELPSASGIGRHLDALSNAGVDSGALISTKLDWVIAGGESGPGARPMHPDWARDLREQCVNAGVAFFFKQWGEWAPGSEFWEKNTCSVDLQGRVAADALRENFPKDASGADGWEMMHRAGKHAAGSLLDGREWKQFPGQLLKAEG